MSEKQEPDTTTGRNPQVGVGNFTCVCGHTMIDADEPGDQSVTLMTTQGRRPFSDDDILECPECEREWWLEDLGVQWRVSK